MTVYIAGPDGKPIVFATHEEADAYRAAQREAEPPWLQRLRQRHSEVCRMIEEAHRALAQPHGRGRGEALNSLASGLRMLGGWLKHDIETAERDRGGER
jgi:hypothetical protein